MLIRNNKNAAVDIFIPSLELGKQRFRVEAKATAALPDELDDAISGHAGNADLLKSGDLEIITPDHVRVMLPEDASQPTLRLTSLIDDEAWRLDPYRPSDRAVILERGESALVHPDFLAPAVIQRRIESGGLELLS